MVEKKTSHFFIHIVFILISICCVVPIFYIVAASFSDELLLKQLGYALIPRGLSMDAYKHVFESPKAILSAYGVSISVTVIGTVVSLLFTTMLGYVMTRRDFKGSRYISFLVFFAMMFNAGMVPTYIAFVRWYHLRDTLIALILPYVIVPWHVFLMKSFLADTPYTLIEAARIDGAGELRTFFQIVVPLAKPALATVGLFTAFTYWNDWYQSMMYIENQTLISLQYYMYRIMNNISFLSQSMFAVGVDLSKLPSETTRMAMCVLAAGPMLIVFPFFQKYFVKGMTVGSVKG